MSAAVTVLHPSVPSVDTAEWLRYAGYKGAPDTQTENLMQQCLALAHDAFAYQLCYTVLPVTATADGCTVGPLHLTSRQLSENLRGCTQAVVFAATVGIGIDRLIARYSRLSPATALLLQALGTQRIEALCDTFCDTLKQTYTVRARFSPGYGDLPLTCQTELFALLNCSKYIGLTLNDSLLMSPTKSVTAFVGLGNK